MKKFLLFLLLIPSVCFAQLDGKIKYDEYEPIVIKCSPTLSDAETATYVWSTPKPLRVVKVSENTIHVWTPPGSHVISVTVVTVDWTTRSVSVKEYTQPFVVAGAAPIVDPVDPVDPVVDPLDPIVKSDFVAVIYESDDFIPPPYVTGALRHLRGQGLEVRAFDKDVVSGGGDVPKQVSAALAAARKIRLPALILVRNGKVVKSVRLPNSTSGILSVVTNVKN